MKKTFVLMTALAFSCATLKAQQTSFGIKAGVQQNTLSLKQKEGSDWSRTAIIGTGFHIGGIADISLSEKFSVQPQILFNSKSTAINSESKINIYAIDIPVNFLYKTGGFFLGLGPNLSYGLSAKLTGDGDEDWYKKQSDGEGGEEKSMLKRFEVGANITLGYQFANNLLISANYTQGLSNVSNYADDGQFGNVSTRFAGLSIGYMFGSKK